MLHRPITTVELIQLNKMFSLNRGYKDLIRDFQKDFGVKLDKQTAKRFLENRSWTEVLKWLTGETIDTGDRDHIPEIDIKHYELLDKMLELNKIDEEERLNDIMNFESTSYTIPADTKFFNMPLYNEIITYKHRDPFLKCFLLNDKRRIDKIEDVPVSKDLPMFLLRILRVINTSEVEGDDDSPTNIFKSDLFVKYGIVKT